MKKVIQTDTAPKAIGPYSQGVQVNKMVYFSGQIPLDPKTMSLVSDDFAVQALQVFTNLQEVCKAAGGDLNYIIKLTIFLTDLSMFPILNDIMTKFFQEPYPARSTIQVSALPKAAQVEIEAIMALE